MCACMYVYISWLVLCNWGAKEQDVVTAESCVCEANRHRVLGKSVTGTKDACSVSSHHRRVLNEDGHVNQDPALFEAYWERWSHTQSCVIEPEFPSSPPWSSCYPLCSLKHCICWQGQGPIICTCRLVNADLGDPFISEWGKVICLSEASCA